MHVKNHGATFFSTPSTDVHRQYLSIGYFEVKKSQLLKFRYKMSHSW